MTTAAMLQAEIDKLRGELEQYKRNELEELRFQLEQERIASAHFRAEAERNAELGRKIHREMQAEIDTMRIKLEAREMQNGRSVTR